MKNMLVALALVGVLLFSVNSFAEKGSGCYSKYRHCLDYELNKSVSQCLDELLQCELDYWM
jgi:hypothetical protein